METEIDLSSALGAESLPSRQIFSLYIPNKDRDGKKINPKPWITEAANILAQMGGGATITPPNRGVFLKEDGTTPQWEDTVIVYTYILDDLFLAGLLVLREFLHRFGRETRQLEVAFEFAGQGDSKFFRIKKYDED